MLKKPRFKQFTPSVGAASRTPRTATEEPRPSFDSGTADLSVERDNSNLTTSQIIDQSDSVLSGSCVDESSAGPHTEPSCNVTSVAPAVEVSVLSVDKENLIEPIVKEKAFENHLQGTDTCHVTAEEHIPAGPSISRYKARSKVRPVIREGSHRIRTFSSASESEDDPGRRRTRTPLSPVKKSPAATCKGETGEQPSSDVLSVPDPNKKRKRKKPSEKSRLELKKEATRRKLASGDVSRENLTMFDLIYYNPKDIDDPTCPKVKPQMRLKPYEVEALAKSNRMNKKEESTDNPILDSMLAEEDEMLRDEAAIANADEDKHLEDKKDDEEEEEDAMPAPQVRFVNGEIVIDDRSLVIDTTEAIKNKNELANAPVVIENSTTAVNYGSWNKRKRSARWSKQETARFHLALRMLGTDFSLMENLFRNRERIELKRKFKSEEKCNRELIEKAIANQIPFDPSQFEDDIGGSSVEEGSQNNEKKEASKGKNKSKRKSKAVTPSENESAEIVDGESVTGTPGKRSNAATNRKRKKEEGPDSVVEPLSGSAGNDEPKEEGSSKARAKKKKRNVAMEPSVEEAVDSADKPENTASKEGSAHPRARSKRTPKKGRLNQEPTPEPNSTIENEAPLKDPDCDTAASSGSINPAESSTPLNNLLQSPLGQMSLEQGGLTVVENPSSDDDGKKQATSFLVPPSLAEANPAFAQAQPGSLVLVSAPNPKDPENQLVHVYRIAVPLESVPT